MSITIKTCWRVARRVLAVLALALLPVAPNGALLAPANAASGRILAIGDSVMLGARSALQHAGVDKVDAKVSRQVTTAPRLLRQRGSGLPRNVVIHLGTNGTFPTTVCRAIVRAVGPDRHVFLVNLKVPRSWERSNNRVVSLCAAMHPDQVTLIDWHRAATQHPEWLYADGMHLRPRGAHGYARVITAAINPG